MWSSVSRVRMKRRTLLSTTGILSTAAIAGCLGGGSSEPDYEIITDLPENIAVSDIKTERFSSELVGDGLTVTGTLENTGDEPTGLPRIGATFYGEGDVQLDTDAEGGLFDSIGPGEKVQFSLVYLGDPEKVTRYTLSFPEVVSTSLDSSNDNQTDTEDSEEETPTPEPVSESFSDDFETGDIRTSRRWSLNLQDKMATEQKEADAEIVAESAPDGGDGSLSVTVRNGGRAVLTSSEEFRWDAPWLVEGLFKPQVRNNRFANTRIGLFGGEVLLDIDFASASAGIIGRNGSVNPVQEDIGEWQDDVWYAYDCEYDGESRFLFTVWEASQTRPSSPTAVTTGRTLSDTEMPMMVRAYAGGDITVNHAFIRYKAGEALE